ncbi:MAG: translocation/assembly module TamB domain-containing protein [Muribaculum sp.]|nr:translocation/assembly module TamB domain-containing protein [Muribaculaceae bacterium]MCM1080465.1 translocation/assembly module TamB domain-containing protein [Muribaculum sp.]
MGHIIHNKYLRRTLKTFFWVLIVVAILPLALYIPAVQDYVVPFALKKVSQASGLTIEADRFRLQWPLRINLEGVRLITAPADTMVALGSADIDVMALPLLKLDIRANAHLENVLYRMGSPDSAMYINARVADFDLAPSSYNLTTGHVAISEANVDGADIDLLINRESPSQPDSASSPVDMLIEAQKLTLRNVRYKMFMHETIDSLGACIPQAVLADGVVNMKGSKIDVDLLKIDGVDVAYIFPPADSTATTVPQSIEEPSDSASLPWQINARHLSLTGRKATYALSGAIPQPGLDMNYIEASNIELNVDSFYNCGSAIRVPLTKFDATERCGVKLSANGIFEMDSAAMYARDFNISTIFSDIKLQAMMGMGDFSKPQSVSLSMKLDARIGAHDIDMIIPSTQALLKPLPTQNDITLVADIDGTMASLNIHKLQAALPGCIELAAGGTLTEPTDMDRLGGQLSLHGAIKQPATLKPLLAEISPNTPINLPQMRLDGTVMMNRGNITGNLKAFAGTGDIALDAMWNGRLTDYDLNLNANSFPIDAFLPDMGIGHVTAFAKVNGHGFDPGNRQTHIDADVTVNRIEYLDHALEDIRMWAKLNAGKADAGIMSLNDWADFDLSASGQLDSLLYNIELDGDVRQLDLKRLGLSETENSGSLSLGGTIAMTPGKQNYDAALQIKALDWKLGDVSLNTPEIGLKFISTDTTVSAALDNETLAARFNSQCGLDSLLAAITKTTAVLDSAIAIRSIHIDSIHNALPQLSLNVKSGAKSVINGFLANSKITYSGFSFCAANDSAIHVDGLLTRLKSPSFALDTISLAMRQQADSLLWNIGVDNRPGTMDNFAHVTAGGVLSSKGLRAQIDQQDIEGKTGYDIGAFIGLADSIAYLHLTPQHPIVAYKEWTVNPNNFVSFDLKNTHFDADLQVSSGESYLQIKTVHDHSHPGNSSEAESIEVKAANIQLSDWLSLSPFAPPIKGLAGADIDIYWDPIQKSLMGKGAVNVSDLTYGKERVGTFDLGLGLSTNAQGVIHASTSLMVDSVKVITAVGALNDSTQPSPMTLDFNMIRFPLSVANPFLPEGMASLRGMLNGTMDVTGTLAEPQFNGFIQFDSAAVRVDMLGTDFTFPDTKIPMDSNVVKFNNYSIHAVNENPLVVNGEVNLKSLSDPGINLRLNANNMQIIGSEKKRGQDAYGKAFINANAKVRGNMNLLVVDASLNLLSGSNFTYVLNTTAAELSQNTDQNSVVRFVEFADTSSISQADSVKNTGMALLLDAALTISPGTTINVDLSGNSQDKVQILGSGNLTFSMSPFSDMRLTGRYNIESGFARYTPPVISQKTFKFQSGSYVAFNGDIMNPILNIHANDELRANVTEEGQNSRLVNFIVSLSVTNTLENMDVSFDLSTNDDLTVQNELQAMSPEQRANQAMNMLLYNVYTGPGTKASSTMPSNPLFNFLASRLNSWAANTIKGVDIQFGVDQYDRTVEGATSTAMSYSYKVSKTLFNDRFKINVGGNYTTDAGDSENLEQNLINDVSVEYMLNKAGSMYIKLFRHVGYESILEGEVTQTGLGFVYKRKLNSLTEMFFPWRHRRPKAPQPAAVKPENAINDNEK